jgi:hypothetical protein
VSGPGQCLVTTVKFSKEKNAAFSRFSGPNILITWETEENVGSANNW